MWFDYQKRMSPLRGTAPTGLLWLGLVSLGAADELFPSEAKAAMAAFQRRPLQAI